MDATLLSPDSYLASDPIPGEREGTACWRREEPCPKAPSPAPAANPTGSGHYEPGRHPLTTDQQQRNHELLQLAQRTTRTMAEASS
ncbi:hypothetical protein ACWC4A_52540 [Streptomyces mirabilis]